MNLNRQNRSRGSALLAALCFTAVLALGVTSYMAVCYRTLALSTRSLQHERTWQIAELALEDALWSLNQAGVTGFSADNGWTLTGTTATKTISGLSYENNVTASVSIQVQNVTASPGDRSVSVTSTTTLADGTVITRSLGTTAEPMPLFVNALAAVSVSDKASTQVRFYSAGNVDSYRSADGAYDASTNSGWGAVVASNDKVVLNRGQIKGYIAIDSSSSSALTYTTSATLKGPSTPVTTPIDATRVSSATVQPIYSVNPSTGAGTYISSYPSSMTLGSPGDTTPRTYYASDLYIPNSTTLIIDGPVKLVVSGWVNVTGRGRIMVTNSGSLELFVGSDLYVTVNNNYGFINSTGDPKKMAIFSTSTSARTFDIDQMSSSSAYHFYGVVYAPESTIELRGNGDYFGSFVAKRVNVRETLNIHYDASLQEATFTGLSTPYGVTERTETTNN